MNEEEAKIKKLEIFSNMYGSLLLEKNRTITFIIQMFIALLVIASFSDKIIPNYYIQNLKILIILLLAIIPIMIIDQIMQINSGLNSLHKALEFKEPQKKWYISIIDSSNYIYTLISIIIIDIIIQFISQNYLVSLLIYILQILIVYSVYSLKKHNETLSKAKTTGSSITTKNYNMKILKYFFANFLSGIVLSYLAILLLLLNFGLDAPNYVFYIILATSSIGIVISNFLSKKFLKKIYIFDIITYLIFILATLFFIGIEDWKVVFALTLMSMLYSILPAIIFTFTLNLKEIFKKNLTHAK